MRLHDWQLRLQACITASWSRPFQWGVHDCVLFAADCVLAVSGVDPAEPFRGKYDDAAGAARVLHDHGGVEAMAAAALGEEIPPLFGQVGDVGLFHEDGRPGLAVCGGGHWLAPGALELGPIATDSIVRAWRCC